jgi:hypothetical protein
MHDLQVEQKRAKTKILNFRHLSESQHCNRAYSAVSEDYDCADISRKFSLKLNEWKWHWSENLANTCLETIDRFKSQSYNSAIVFNS